MSLNRDKILGYVAKPKGKVDVAEFGGEVWIAELTVDEADQFRTLGTDGVPANVRLAVMGACDEKGARLFSEDDIPALRKLPAAAMTTIGNAVLRLNGASGEAADEAKNDSSGTETDASASASPSPSDEP